MGRTLSEKVESRTITRLFKFKALQRQGPGIGE
jgi:hypothetical protein